VESSVDAGLVQARNGDPPPAPAVSPTALPIHRPSHRLDPL